MKMIAWMVPVSALLLIAVAVPLLLRKVPPNPLYGFRTPRTMSDEGLWYRANARAGVNMVGAGMATVLVWTGLVLGMGLTRSAMPGMAIFSVAVFAALMISLVQLRSM